MCVWLSVSWPGVWRPPARRRRCCWPGPWSSRPGCGWPPAAGAGSPAGPSRRRVRPTLLFGWNNAQRKKKGYLLVVVGRQQEQEREGKSDVGALGHVLVRHFPLWDTEHNWRKILRADGSFGTRAAQKRRPHGWVEGQ